MKTKQILIYFLFALVAGIAGKNAFAGYDSPMTGSQAYNVLRYGQKTGPGLGQVWLPTPSKGMGNFIQVYDVGGATNIWRDYMKTVSVRFKTDVANWQAWIDRGPMPMDIYNPAIMEGRYNTPLPLYTEAVRDGHSGDAIQCYPGFLFSNKREAGTFAHLMGGKILNMADYGLDKDMYFKLFVPTVEAYAWGNNAQMYPLNLYKVPFQSNKIYYSRYPNPVSRDEDLELRGASPLSSFPWKYTDNNINQYASGYYQVKGGYVPYDGKRFSYPSWKPFGRGYTAGTADFVVLPSTDETTLAAGNTQTIVQSVCVRYPIWD